MVAAWDPVGQAKAQGLHARGRLFDGDRKENTPVGQESEPAELEKDELAKLSNAPLRPSY